MTGNLLLAVSIDTEEDNWMPTRQGMTVENVKALSRLVRAIGPLGLRPTFFTTHAVCRVPAALAAVREAAGQLGGEVGAHLHPWNTPPLDGPTVVHDTMLNNYPRAWQEAKLRALTEQFAEGAGGWRPRVFRAGRFGLGPETVQALLACGYVVDSSVTPYFSWAEYDHGPDFVGAPLGVYRLDGRGDVRTPVADGELIEVPLSAGYTRFAPERWPRVAEDLNRPLSRRVHLAGLGARLGIVRRVILSPEAHSLRQMTALARRLVAAGHPFLHLFFHSSSLRPGLSPFTRTDADVGRLLDRVARFVDWLARRVEPRPVPVSAVAEAP